MGKEYSTGKDKWRYEQPTDYRNGTPYHKLLGPCPDCGSPTFDYGGGWRCCGSNERFCKRTADNPAPNVGKAPAWWNTDVNVYMDGESWCATRDGFDNPMEGSTGFGETPSEAVANLIKNEEDIKMKNSGLYDKNGKEIQKGDIFDHPAVYGEVLFEDGMFTLSMSAKVNFGGHRQPLCYCDTSLGEVIGNSTDNPELLKEAK